MPLPREATAGQSRDKSWPRRIDNGKRRHIPKRRQCTVDTAAVEPPGRGLPYHDTEKSLPPARSKHMILQRSSFPFIVQAFSGNLVWVNAVPKGSNRDGVSDVNLTELPYWPLHDLQTDEVSDQKCRLHPFLNGTSACCPVPADVNGTPAVLHRKPINLHCSVRPNAQYGDRSDLCRPR